MAASRILSMLIVLAALVASAHAQAVQPDFSLAITHPHTPIKLGSPIPLEITITNVSTHELDISLGYPIEFQFGIDVVDSQGASSVQLTDFGRRIRSGETGKGPGIGFSGGGIGTRKPGSGLKPGQSLKVEALVDRSYDFSRSGEYKIQVYRSDPASKTVVKSNVVTVTVTP
jgi:hypothetical protein